VLLAVLLPSQHAKGADIFSRISRGHDTGLGADDRSLSPVRRRRALPGPFWALILLVFL
jgi:hypothetical protein